MKKRIYRWKIKAVICCMSVLMLMGCQKEQSDFETNQIKAETESKQETKETETILDLETETVVVQEEQEQISLLMVGDILLHTPVEEAALQSDGTYDFTEIFAHTKDEIQQADIALVNQEVIIGGEELGISGYPAFNAPYAIGDALVDAGFDVICHATNHALDKGSKGLLNCISFWKEQYSEIAILGIHDSQQSQNELYVYEQDGMKIAVLNYTYGTNGISMPQGMQYAVDLLEEQKVAADIKRAEEEADFTIVCPHWGTEYQLEYSAAQTKWTNLFAQCGADLVIGTHPHVIQPIEWVVDEASGHEMLVYYSLGNFVNWTSESGSGIANRMVGGMANVVLTKEGEEIVISDYDVIPLVCHLANGTNGVTVYKLADYTEELAKENQICLQDPAFSLQYCNDLCKNVWNLP